MRRTGPSQAVRDGIYLRDGFRCVICQDSDFLQIHHRRPRGMGGTRRESTNGPAGLVLLCERCHAAVESQRDLARQRGFLVPQHTEPADVALIHHGVWSWLADDFTVTPLGASDLPGSALSSDQGRGLGDQDGDAA